MKLNLQNIGEYAERFVRQQMDKREWTDIKAQLEANETLRTEWQEQVTFFSTLEAAAAHRNFKLMVAEVATASRPDHVLHMPSRRVMSLTKYLKMGSVAAAIALLSSVATYHLATNQSKNNSATQYRTLSKKIDALKDSQSQIINNISGDKKIDAEPAMPGNFGGSGFAISNDGYVATDYHVVDGADSIFIQTADGRYHKSYIVAFEPANDIAILKVESNSFRFGKGSLPYTISKGRSDLAQPVFTLGYPQDNVVYNEGYISGEKGYQGDARSYMLEITANPGQSGSPVFDQNGNIIALVTAKETSATYAIQSAALIELAKTLPKAANLQMPEKNKLSRLKRTEQVKKAADYMCAVKVYK